MKRSEFIKRYEEAIYESVSVIADVIADAIGLKDGPGDDVAASDVEARVKELKLERDSYKQTAHDLQIKVQELVSETDQLAKDRYAEYRRAEVAELRVKELESKLPKIEVKRRASGPTVMINGNPYRNFSSEVFALDECILLRRFLGVE